MLPAIMPVEAEINLHKGTPLRPLGLANEMQSGFQGRVVGLPGIALDAGANNIFPRRRAAAIARNYMVQV